MATWTENLPATTGAPADRAYILCATPRSGSTMLCGMLADAGAGWPASYFREKTMADRMVRLGVAGGPDAFPAYLDAVRRTGSAGTEICGIRLMQENAAALFCTLGVLFPDAEGDLSRLEAAFGPVSFIHLSRRDKLAQAVSYIRARQSGLWHRGAGGQAIEALESIESKGYAHDRIAEIVATYRREDAAWTDWFTDQGITPISVTYEDLAAAPQKELGRILAALSLDATKANAITPATQPMADPESRAWIQRFRQAHPDT
ncbi:MAG: Stf0 family sulfotransferase [Pseudomonadota bacterium]